ncbi:hypothetical protein FPQ18DRAFT_359587 [Pyronema domesticum]|nr:hypothetical protein FPQ18DRAFT_359587 [Pyronema domesticum]
MQSALKPPVERDAAKEGWAQLHAQDRAREEAAAKATKKARASAMEIAEAERHSAVERERQRAAEWDATNEGWAQVHAGLAKEAAAAKAMKKAGADDVEIAEAERQSAVERDGARVERDAVIEGWTQLNAENLAKEEEERRREKEKERRRLEIEKRLKMQVEEEDQRIMAEAENDWNKHKAEAKKATAQKANEAKAQRAAEEKAKAKKEAEENVAVKKAEVKKAAEEKAAAQKAAAEKASKCRRALSPPANPPPARRRRVTAAFDPDCIMTNQREFPPASKWGRHQRIGDAGSSSSQSRHNTQVQRLGSSSTPPQIISPPAPLTPVRSKARARQTFQTSFRTSSRLEDSPSIPRTPGIPITISLETHPPSNCNVPPQRYNSAFTPINTPVESVEASYNAALAKEIADREHANKSAENRRVLEARLFVLQENWLEGIDANIANSAGPGATAAMRETEIKEAKDKRNADARRKSAEKNKKR